MGANLTDMNVSEEISSRTAAADRTAAEAAPLRSIARGSAWTIGARWSMRCIGLASTLILARLLEPGDFGIVAMAMVAVALVQVFSEAGQNLAVIRHSDPTREHFDTAWTMSVIAGFCVALGLLAVAPLAGWYYEEPRVVPVIRFLALAPLIEGFTNVGVIAGFRRDLAFGKDFSILVIRKLSTAAVTVPMAVLFHNFWALAIGAVAGRVIIVAVSYWLHPYRPQLRLTALQELWSFSAWMQLTEIGNFFAERVDQIIIGGMAGAGAMGTYNVAADLAASPTEELVLPAARATFPVYATMLHDPVKLAKSYLDVLSITAIVACATGFGVALIADDFVALLLGPKWLAAIPLVPWLAVGAAILGVGRTVNTMLSVTGNARLIAVRLWASVAILVPGAVAGGIMFGAEGVAIARLVVTILFIPVMFYSLALIIPVTYAAIFKRLWRPGLATLVMCTAVSFGALRLDPGILRLLYNIGLGAIAFASTLLALWLVAGRPAGGEQILINQARSTAGAISQWIGRLPVRLRSTTSP